MDAAPLLRGSELLLGKLPLVAKAHALARQDPADPQAECNVLSYGTDVYRVLACRDTPVALPTHMTFLTALETARREEKEKETETDTTTAVHSNEKKKRKEEEKEKDNSEAENEEEEEDEEAVLGSVPRGKEELKLLHAIREPLERVGESVRGSENKKINNNNNSISSSGIAAATAPAGRISWELLLDSLMTRGAAAGDEDDEKVRSYLRRVSWIGQQKKLHAVHSGSLESRGGSEQPWMSMSEAMRVQKEIQRMRTQRNRFHRAKKE
ncbi:uncharacterized protein TM35_000232100 [Trypanosoma theileri]|uniref:Uncharacterized protein n=1 Tax=Trypanosoma theileri TaxID=67003 RepID=A0A1X0NSS3_9TRYP|nr:uncharacterized protein TM35_000232100 [Trypanosoma theileri]ORC87239.1 hypothetical protein TM35_000232100 [Trypanosoma theileri]